MEDVLHGIQKFGIRVNRRSQFVDRSHFMQDSVIAHRVVGIESLEGAHTQMHFQDLIFKFTTYSDFHKETPTDFTTSEMNSRY